MNRKINILDDLTINKIAAGEVVEGPYSVVKELVENAIDAKASSITLEIKEGGKKYIRVTDNGVGIQEEYVEKAFLRHSTSKISDITDLDSIASLGFRGEALASIAAISHVEMVTRTGDQEYGVFIELEGGKIQTIKQVGCPIGTTIIVKNIFLNTPARLKFMKSIQSETIKITEIISRLSLSRPDISFKYINNNNIMFTTPGNNVLSDAILSVFDINTFKNLISIESETNKKYLNGYISQPTFVRGNRNLQIIFVNGRYVKNRLISKAIEDAYKEKIIIHKHPICILNINIDSKEIDVNVHPAKTEIKFQREEEIYDFIFNSISTALNKNMTIPRLGIIKPEVDRSSPRSSHLLNLNIGKDKDHDHIDSNSKMMVNDHKGKYMGVDDANLDLGFIRGNGNSAVTSNRINNNFIDLEDNTEEELKKDVVENNIIQESFLSTLLDQYKIVGQIFNTYIILEKDAAIYLIDQHAAHERLLYNKFMKEIEEENVVSQRLLQPEVLELSAEDYLLIYNNIHIFTGLGFQIESFGSNTIIIREVPMILGKPQGFSFIYEVIDEVRNSNNMSNHFESTIIKKACKAAIKAKDKLEYNEIKRLIEDITSLAPPLTCPHGRPIVLTMDKYSIEKYFKRIQ